MIGDDQLDRLIRWDPRQSVQERLQPLEVVVHRDERSDNVGRGEPPLSSLFGANAGAIALVEPPGVDRIVNHVDAARIYAEMPDGMLADHRAVDD